jgi:hypothetical protein
VAPLPARQKKNAHLCAAFFLSLSVAAAINSH